MSVPERVPESQRQRAPQTIGSQTMSNRDSRPVGNCLPRRLDFYLGAGIELFIVPVHIFMHLACMAVTGVADFGDNQG
jgi:hypothetical protein